MKKISSLAIAVMVFGTVGQAFALDLGLGSGASAGATVQSGSTTINAKAEARLEARITTAKEHGDKEIDRRVAALNEINARVDAMARLSASQKSSMATFINGQISSLLSVKAKIDADTDIAQLKTDIKSITQSYRIFLLIMPQAHITVASDKILDISAKLTTLESKLKSRIADAKNAGSDVSAMESADVDMAAKLSDADNQANAAISLVVNLTPDNGDQTKGAANKKALQDARAKIKAAMDDLRAARKDAGTIVSALAQLNVSASASSSASTQ